MDKKVNERNILDMVYDESEYAEVIESERPDFLMKRHTAAPFFGVEVTELYYSEPEARLNKLPNYFTEIIERDHYRHKVDKTELRAQEFQITSANGEPRQPARGIMRQLPTPNEYASMVAATIKAKGSKFSKYNKELDHINLIIYDGARRLQVFPVDQFYYFLFTLDVKNVLFETPFREVFLVTTLERNKRVYIPLRMLLLWGEFYAFGTLIMEYPWETSNSEPFEESPESASGDKGEHNSIMKLYSQYLRSKTDRVYTRDNAGATEVLLGGCGLSHGKDGMNIYDNSDYPLPTDIKLVEPDELTEFCASEEFRAKAEEILDNFAFSTELVYPVKSNYSPEGGDLTKTVIARPVKDQTST